MEIPCPRVSCAQRKCQEVGEQCDRCQDQDREGDPSGGPFPCKHNLRHVGIEDEDVNCCQRQGDEPEGKGESPRVGL